MARARRRTKDKAQSKGPRISWLDVILYTGLVVVMVGAAFAFRLVMRAKESLPALSNLEPKPSETSFVYDRNGDVWKELHASENRIPVSLDDLPQHFIDAVLAIEDVRFYSHVGVDLRSIARALFVNITQDAFQGGSTITQQLAKKAFLTDSQTITRKIQDAMIAFMLERRYTKDEILEMYVNFVAYGRGAHGPEAAARLFFGKSIKDVSVDEAAFLAGMINGPFLFDPADNPTAGLARRNLVLSQMAQYGLITPEEADEYKQVALVTLPVGVAEASQGAYYFDYVLKQLLARYPSEAVYGGGLRVYTAYNPLAQEAMDKAICDTLDKDFPYVDKDSMQAAAVVMDVKTGYVLAMSGGRKHEGLLAWNRAVDMKRQPGSSFKPLAVYVPALEAGITPTTLVEDSPITWVDPITDESFSPTNYSGTFSEEMVTVRYAVEQSLNVIAAKIQDMVGIPKCVETATRLGITSLVTQTTADGLNDYTRSLAMGGLTYGVSPLEMAVAFGTLSNGGVRTEPITILRVEDKNGVLLEEHETKRTLAISQEISFLMTNMLEDVIKRGTGMGANIGRPAAGKTGTTSDWKDAWFAGYTPTTVGIVWMGFDEGKTMQQWKITGGSYPASMWARMMRAIETGPAVAFTVPEGVVPMEVCKTTGLLPGPWCPAETLYTEYFLKDEIPLGICDHEDPMPEIIPDLPQ